MHPPRRRICTLAASAALLVLGACADPAVTTTRSSDEVGDAFGSSASVESASAVPVDPEGSGGTTADGAAAGTSTGGCALGVTGDYTTTIASGEASSDHWLTRDQVSRARARGGGGVRPGSTAGGAGLPEPAAGTAPMFNWLVISCGEEGGEGFKLLANDDATATDIPFAPATYSIAPGFLSATEDRSELSAIVDVGEPDRLFALTAGTVTITGFDETGVRGTVSMQLERTPTAGAVERARLTGHFELPCSGGDLCRTGAEG